jgi:hypothetical protein
MICPECDGRRHAVVRGRVIPCSTCGGWASPRAVMVLSAAARMSSRARRLLLAWSFWRLRAAPTRERADRRHLAQRHPAPARSSHRAAVAIRRNPVQIARGHRGMR